MVHTLNDAGDYFREIVEPTVAEFFNTASTFKTAFAVAAVLFHANEWLWEYDQKRLEAEFGESFPTQGKLWAFVESQVSEAGYIRDVANASKHVRLTRKPSTSMTHVANTSIQFVAYGSGVWGAGRYGGGPNVTMKDGSSDVSFDDCVNKLIGFWRPLVAKLYP